MDQFLESLFSRLKAAQGLEAGVNPAPASVKVATFGDALEAAVPDAVRRQKVYDSVVGPILTKLVRTPDISSFRVASLSDRMATRRNNATPFLNYLESQGAPSVINDYQHRFREWNIGADEAELWNVEEDLPGEAKSNRAVRDNTLTCVGNTVNITMMTQEMLQQQAQIDLMARELDMEVTRIRRTMNKLLIANVENKGEGQFSVPQLGGFLTRSVMYNVNAGGSDLTRSLIQGRLDAMANIGSPEGFGYGLPWLAFTNVRQIQVLRDIIISEYNGIDPMSRIAYENNLRQRLAPYNVNVDMVFEANPGGVIPFVIEPQLPVGTTIIFDADQPRLAKMRLMGQLGPWFLTRPTEKLQTKNVMFDLFSLEDPLVDTRSVISNHAG